MGKSIDHGNGAAGLEKEAGSRFRSTPQLIRSMSLQLAIPWRVGLHQSLEGVKKSEPFCSIGFLLNDL